MSQAEVAFLLGRRGGAEVCRFEQFIRTPDLKTALAYEVIFQQPIRELFAGLFQQVEQTTTARAKVLIHRTNLQKSDKRTQRKRRTLTTITAKQAASLDMS